MPTGHILTAKSKQEENAMPEVTAQKVYMIHCEDCGLLYINNDTANPDESDGPGNDYSTTTTTLADAKRSIAAHKRYHAKEEAS
jgi:hypothetical protein